jgi:hypothetical protein
MDASSLPAVFPAGLAADKAPRDIAVGQVGSKIPREDMILPPLVSFPTLEELQDFSHTWAFEHGYGIVVKSTPGPGRIRMTCARARNTRNTRKLEDSQRRRRTTSNKCGCPFRLWFLQEQVIQDDELHWTIEHFNDLGATQHNHNSIHGRSTVVNQRHRRLMTNRLA